MKTDKRLKLSQETLRVLKDEEAAKVAGGIPSPITGGICPTAICPTRGGGPCMEP